MRLHVYKHRKSALLLKSKLPGRGFINAPLVCPQIPQNFYFVLNSSRSQLVKVLTAGDLRKVQLQGSTPGERLKNIFFFLAPSSLLLSCSAIALLAHLNKNHSEQKKKNRSLWVDLCASCCDHNSDLSFLTQTAITFTL